MRSRPQREQQTFIQQCAETIISAAMITASSLRKLAIYAKRHPFKVVTTAAALFPHKPIVYAQAVSSDALTLLATDTCSVNTSTLAMMQYGLLPTSTALQEMPTLAFTTVVPEVSDGFFPEIYQNREHMLQVGPAIMRP